MHNSINLNIEKYQIFNKNNKIHKKKKKQKCIKHLQIIVYVITQVLK